MVNKDSPLNMTLCELSGSSHVQDNDTGISNKVSKLLNIGILKIILAASRCKPYGGQQACQYFSHNLLVSLEGKDTTLIMKVI